jgi:UDP-N-acetylglucosamine acyltransferase
MPERIHPTAIIDPAAELAPDVSVGPHAIVEGPVRLGPGCIVRARAHLLGDVAAGSNNDFGIGCVVGERAQHLGHRDAAGRVDIGDDNTFRETVTIHRGTPGGPGTRVGNGNFLMVNTHVAHDGFVGDGCVFANGAVIGGHTVIEDGVFLSGNTGIHQNCRIGRLAIVSATSSATKDVPPFAILEGRNLIVGVNLIGLKRAAMSETQITAVRQAYRVILASGLLLSAATAKLERELGHVDVVAELLKFILTSKRGICLTRARRRRGE